MHGFVLRVRSFVRFRLSEPTIETKSEKQREEKATPDQSQSKHTPSQTWMELGIDIRTPTESTSKRRH